MTTKEDLLNQVLATVKELENHEGDVYEFMDDALSIESYMVFPDGEFKGGEVLMSWGGPTIWITTWDSTVHGSWGSDSFTKHYGDNIGIHEYLEEIYSTIKGG